MIYNDNETQSKRTRAKREIAAYEVTINNLNIREGAGKNYKATGEFIKPGAVEIIETNDGEGSNNGWGKLADGRGWISLDYCKRI